MSVVIETTLGDITVDLFLEQRPVTCLNFLKLCKMKYYNFNLFHSIRSGFIAQTGDPTGEGSGGQSIFGLLEGPDKRFFSGEKMPKIRHTDTGYLSMVGSGDMMIGSQFFFTLGPDLDSLDGCHCVIGEVTEGQDVLRKLNDVICDETHRPYQDVRITHTVVLEDPYNDPPEFRAPSRSPSPSAERLKGGRIAPDEELDETQGKSAEEIQELIEEKEAKARATILEIVGDIPDAEIAPPENVLFVCKLNPVTTDEDLEIIFSRFGKIVSCEVIRDKKTGDSLQYAFIEFADKKSCEDAYFKMDNVLIDDRRIHVDFSQSVSKIRWLGKGRGVQHLNDDNVNKDNHFDTNKSKRPQSNDRERSDYGSHRDHVRDRNRYNNSKEHRDKKYDNERGRREDRRYNMEDNNYNNGEDSRREEKKYNTDDKKSSHDKDRRERSRSRSRRDRSREKRNGQSHNSHRDYNNIENPRSEQNNKIIKNDSSDTGRKKEYKHSTSHNSSSKRSPIRNDKRDSSKSPSRKHKERSEKPSKDVRIERSRDTNDRNNEHSNRNSKRHRDDRENSTSKSKVVEDRPEKTVSKRRKHDAVEPRTPSPAGKKGSKTRLDDGKKKKVKVMVKQNKSNKKKRRRSSSSSDSDSSDSSSSSSDTSSSSDSDRKKKSVKRKKRKPSSSSSSTSDTSSSSSSSDSSSDSSSSSSDSDHKRKRKLKNNSKQKLAKKSKKN